MEAAAGGSSGSGEGGGGGGNKPEAPVMDLPDHKHETEYVGGFTKVRDLKKTIRPFQLKLSEIEKTRKNKKKKQKLQEEVLKQRDVKIYEEHSEFWSRVISLSPGLKGHFLADQQPFKEIRSIEVTENDTVRSIKFDVKENKYFNNTVFGKSYPLGDGTGEVLGTKVAWKEGMDPSEWLGHKKSFFEWFGDTTPFQEDILGQEVVKLYERPLEDVKSDEDDWIGREAKSDEDDWTGEEAEREHDVTSVEDDWIIISDEDGCITKEADMQS